MRKLAVLGLFLAQLSLRAAADEKAARMLDNQGNLFFITPRGELSAPFTGLPALRPASLRNAGFYLAHARELAAQGDYRQAIRVAEELRLLAYDPDPSFSSATRAKKVAAALELRRAWRAKLGERYDRWLDSWPVLFTENPAARRRALFSPRNRLTARYPADISTRAFGTYTPKRDASNGAAAPPGRGLDYFVLDARADYTVAWLEWRAAREKWLGEMLIGQALEFATVGADSTQELPEFRFQLTGVMGDFFPPADSGAEAFAAKVNHIRGQACVGNSCRGSEGQSFARIAQVDCAGYATPLLAWVGGNNRYCARSIRTVRYRGQSPRLVSDEVALTRGGMAYLFYLEAFENDAKDARAFFADFLRNLVIP